MGSDIDFIEHVVHELSLSVCSLEVECHDPKGRALASSIGSQEPQDLPFLDHERVVVDSADSILVDLGDLLGLDRVVS